MTRLISGSSVMIHSFKILGVHSKKAVQSLTQLRIHPLKVGCRFEYNAFENQAFASWSVASLEVCSNLSHLIVVWRSTSDSLVVLDRPIQLPLRRRVAARYGLVSIV